MGWDRDGDGTITKAEFIDYYADISAGIHNDQYCERMIRNAWHLSGGQGVCRNTTCLRVLVTYTDGRQGVCRNTPCLRVLVTYTDGRQGVVEVENDLGLDRTDTAEIRRRLQKQGVRHIQSVQCGGG